MGGGDLSAQRHFTNNGTWKFFCIVLFLFPLYATCNQFALLTGTLKTFQKHACDQSTLEISCPANTSIDINHANYGVWFRSKDVPCPPSPTSDASTACQLPSSIKYKTTQRVLDSCHARRYCSMEVKATTFTGEDFCPLLPKYIEVAYKCRPDTFINKIICGGETLTMHCGRDSKIAIYSILFGRSGKEELQCPQPPGVPEDSCAASFATESVMRLCHGLSHCQVPASTSFFGRPCPPQYTMYMKAVYTCVPQMVLKLPEIMGTARGTQDVEKVMTIVSDSELRKTLVEDKDSRGKQLSPKNATPSQPKTLSKDMIINCTVTILSGSDQKEIGLVTEWIKAVAYINKNFERVILYIVVGACLGTLLCLLAVSLHLLRERRKERGRRFVIPEQFSSTLTDGDRLDEGEMTAPTCSSSSDNYSPTPSHSREQEAVRYYTGPHSRPRYNDTDLILPRSLSRENNHHLYN